MLRKYMLIGLSALLIFSFVGCETDMEVVNQNDPETTRVLAEPADLEAFMGGTMLVYWTYWQNYYQSMGLSVMGEENTSSWGNFGMRDMGSEPRQPWVNSPTYGSRWITVDAWAGAYQVITSSVDGLRILEGLEFVGDDAQMRRDRLNVWGNFMLGLAHGSVSLLFDRGFIVKPETNIEEITLSTYQEINAASIEYLEKVISLCASSVDFTLPNGWINGRGDDISRDLIAKWAHSLIARNKAQVARNPADKASVDWTSVISHARQGVSSYDEAMYAKGDGTDWIWANGAQVIGALDGWSRAENKLVGPGEYWNTPEMEAANGTPYADWHDTVVADRMPFTLYTTDRRVTGADDDQTPGKYIMWLDPEEYGYAFPASRGTYHHSQYGFTRYEDASWYETMTLDIPFILNEEMDMLIAEGLMRTVGANDEVLELINKTRVGVGEMAPMTAADTEEDVFRALMYEKRMETFQTYSGGHYFDYRGWRDKLASFAEMPKGTLVHFPVPATEIELYAELFPDGIYTFGGAGDPTATPKITVDYINGLKDHLNKKTHNMKARVKK